MATKTASAPEVVKPMEDQLVRVRLPMLEEEKEGSVDQTEIVQCPSKNGGRPYVIQRGEFVDIPVWAFEILVHSGRYTDKNGRVTI